VLAARLYCLESGKPLRDLSELVPNYLPTLPEDPYTGRTFGYRLSEGEVIEVDGSGGTGDLGLAFSVARQVATAMAIPDGGATALFEMGRIVHARNLPPSPIGMRLASINLGPAPPRASRTESNLSVLAASMIVWSAGPDGKDDGGRRTPRRGVLPGVGQDWVFILPPPRVKGN
jgi:hypothetical protein